jgi:hypothetical protein
MHNLLLFDQAEKALPADAIERVFKSVEGFVDVRYNTPIGIPLEADYVTKDDHTVVGLEAQRRFISINGTSNAAIQAAWVLQSHLGVSLRLIDTAYSFDLRLREFATIEQLQEAMHKAWQNRA